MNIMTRTPLIIPCQLDEQAVLDVLSKLNLLKSGAKTFGNMEIRAACKWALVPHQEVERLLDAVGSHGLFRQPEAVPPHIPWRMPLRNRRTPR